ncbi:LAFE_0C09758g1_1 [Lachancea fermentati]|uniref:LAFE_0C09758g1_1 n=1 Tax=Lachancea fermentati TaxID=4955 RepID=A0A1G4MAF3_LACFM|nr:LAFE_0C09758g1_1 [Lachancea fermentati]
MNNVAADETVLKSLQVAAQTYSNYISAYIDVLNKYIGHQRRVSTLRFERATLIKFVKKLRFFNEYLYTLDYVEIESGDKNLVRIVTSLASFFIRCLEMLDLLNYYLTQSLKNETISKTLNKDLTVSEDCIAYIEDTYRHFVKFTQWMVESLNLKSADLSVEIVQFARKCAKEDGLNTEDTEEILLQEINLVSDVDEYQELLDEWCRLLTEKYMTLNAAFENEATYWSEVFDHRK